jgi:hypothetical protein
MAKFLDEIGARTMMRRKGEILCKSGAEKALEGARRK